MAARTARLRLPVAVLAVGLVAGAAAAQGGHPADGRIGPQRHLLGNGRQLHPAGHLVPVGNFPTGGALTPDGRFYWTVSTGRGFNDIRILSVASRQVVQVLPIPGASGGIAMDPHRPVAYVSGIADSSHKDQQRPGLPGRGGDVIQVIRYDPESGRASYADPIAVPPPSSAPIPQNFPPTNTAKQSWPDRLALSPDGSTLLVPLNLADAAAIVDTRTRAVRYVSVGHYPYGAAILPDNRTGLVSNETDGTVSVIDLASGTTLTDIQVGAHLSHPEAIAVDPHADRAYVAIANSDQVAVIDTGTRTLARTLSVERPAGLGTAPVALTVTPDGSHLIVAESGGDELAVFRLPPASSVRATPSDGGFELIGRIPTADYPADVAVSPAGPTLLYLAAKGLGVGPNPDGPNPYITTDDNTHAVTYLPNVVDGMVGVLPLPDDEQVRRLTPVASRQLVPTDTEAAPAGTPIRPDGPIKHVFYIVRENRTYDQELGDLGRGDGDPKLTLFGRKYTPNLHALVTRFPLLDHVYANSEASIDGHFWTSAGSVSDYVNKAWFQNYAGRQRPYDFGVYSVTFPANGFLFDQAERQGISYFNYGEAIAGVVPLPDKDRTPTETAEVLRKFAHSDLGAGTKVGLGATPAGECYPNDASIAKDAISGLPVWDSSPPPTALTAASRFDCFKTRFTGQLATGTVPAFNYLVLANDHTLGTSPGERTPGALIADNDYGLGQIVDLISHSPIWSSSAIFVIEDDSQDGADHVDAHRIPAAVISPYAKQGAIVHDRYDFLSVIRSMELILGMHPLGLYDQLAVPMYDAFTPEPRNSAPYSAILPAVDRTATNSASAPDAALSAGLDFSRLDQIPQRTLDAILWHAMRGDDSAPPPPGPNAVLERAAPDGD